MIEIALIVVIFILSGLIGWLDYNNRKERKSLLNALKAKDAQDMANLELVDKTKPEEPPPDARPDIVPLNQLSDEDYEKFIEREIE